MLALAGLVTILLLLVLLLTKRMSALVALIAIPTGMSLICGFGFSTATFIVKGIQSVAPVAGMFIFAILYFGVMTDAGMLDPIVDRILRAVGNRPSRIVPGTALLALLVHLDGSGAVTFLVTVPVMLPLYQRVGIDKRILACAASLAAGVNFLPWTGPMIRASAALHIPVGELFNPLIPVQIGGLIFVFGICFWLGKREEQRLRISGSSATNFAPAVNIAKPDQALRRPRLFWVNLALTIVLMSTMISGKIEPVVVFMVGLGLALVINYPNVDQQRARIDAHARAALLMAAILFAAGAFTGIMTNSGMLKSMAQAVVNHIPANMAHQLPVALALTSMPLSYFFDPDSFYFGVLPVVSEVAKTLGVPPLQVAQAALMGLHTTGFPISPLTPATFLLVGLCEIDLAEHQRFATLYLFLASVAMTILCLVLRIFPW